MIKKILLGMFVIMLFTSCTHFEIKDEVFTQEKMAHSAYLGTMYRSETQQDGDHDCDDTPSNCCVAGYHMCTRPEMEGGREIEDSGTSRNASIYDVYADVDSFGSALGLDCNSWVSNLGTNKRSACKFNTTLNCEMIVNSCDDKYATWCCSSG